MSMYGFRSSNLRRTAVAVALAVLLALNLGCFYCPGVAGSAEGSSVIFLSGGQSYCLDFLNGTIRIIAGSYGQDFAEPGTYSLDARFSGEVAESARIPSRLQSQHVELEPLRSALDRQSGSDADPSRAFFTDLVRNLVLVIDIATVETLGAIPVGRTPLGLAFSPDGTTLYVANSRSGDISVIDVVTLAETERLTLDNAQPLDVAVTPDGSQLLVATNEGSGGTVFFIDTATMETIGQRRTSPDPERIEISPDGVTAYVLATASDSIAVLDTLTRRNVGGFRVDQGTDIFVSPDGRQLFVSGGGPQGKLMSFDTANLSPSGEWALGDTPVRINAAPGGQMLLISHLGSGFVTLVDPRAQDQAVINIPAPAGLGPAIITLSM